MTLLAAADAGCQGFKKWRVQFRTCSGHQMVKPYLGNFFPEYVLKHISGSNSALPSRSKIGWITLVIFVVLQTALSDRSQGLLRTEIGKVFAGQMHLGN